MAQEQHQRGTTVQRGYDAGWKRLRKWHLTRYPLCVDCGAIGTVVDHIVAVRDDPTRRLDPSNLRTYCESHHNARTWRDQGPGSHLPA